MRNIILTIGIICIPFLLAAKGVMTPELLWKLGRVSFVGQSPDGNEILYKVAHYSIGEEKANSTYYWYDLKKGKAVETNVLSGFSFVQWDRNGMYATKDEVLYRSTDNGKTWKSISGRMKGANDIVIAPDGKWAAISMAIANEKVLGKEIYSDMPKTSAKIYSDLNYRHWDTWSDGKVNHIFLVSLERPDMAIKDILQGEPYDAPTRPFGGAEDFVFSPDSKIIVYVCKKKTGKEYAQSTNTDLYAYNIETGQTQNWTEGMNGYDLSPRFNKDGTRLAWLSMARDGFEADKNDIIVMDLATKKKTNLTQDLDMTVDGSIYWSEDGSTIYYNASVKGVNHLFYTSVHNAKAPKTMAAAQLTKGVFDIAGIHGEAGNNIILSKMDMNHASELFLFNKTSGAQIKGISKANDSIYSSIALSEMKMMMVKTTDGKEMGVWVILPPDFDHTKEYPAILYCQGGPQGALSQFYSFRWNFQLMAAQGYVVIAPNRRGMPGWGVAWNEDISGDWGGQPMQDYLSAVDAVAKETYIDNDRIACVGASYGGYSVFMLAGIHQNRFRTFISHCGLFDMKSWYGTTEELWFANWDMKGNYWQQPVPRSYDAFNPSNFVDKWNKPILIIQGEKDFRVPIGQGLEAFQAAQLKGLKSKLILFPDENHWVLKPQNAMVWHREFFQWLEETMR